MLIWGYLLLLSSCQEGIRQETKQANNFPIVIDTSNYIASYKKAFRIERVEEYEILYIGAHKDTIIANHYLKTPMIPPPFEGSSDEAIISKEIEERLKKNPLIGYNVDLVLKENYKDWKGANIEILLDTNTIINTLGFFSGLDQKCSKAYPVLLKNEERDTIFVAEKGHLQIILEAKDENQTWQPIEILDSYNPYIRSDTIFLVILPPQEIILTACPIYTGDFKTELRLKMGSNYSKPFRGSIKLAQFRALELEFF